MIQYYHELFFVSSKGGFFMIKIGMIGFGQRGSMLLKDVIIPREDIEIPSCQETNHSV